MARHFLPDCAVGGAADATGGSAAGVARRPCRGRGTAGGRGHRGGVNKAARPRQPEGATQGAGGASRSAHGVHGESLRFPWKGSQSSKSGGQLLPLLPLLQSQFQTCSWSFMHALEWCPGMSPFQISRHNVTVHNGPRGHDGSSSKRLCFEQAALEAVCGAQTAQQLHVRKQLLPAWQAASLALLRCHAVRPWVQAVLLELYPCNLT